MPYEVIVVDNCSPLRDGIAEAELRNLLQQIGGCLIQHTENGGYSKGMNLAYRHAKGRYLLVSNPDVVFLPECVDRLLRRLEQDPQTGAAAPEGFWDKGCDGHLPPNILPTMGDLLALTLASVSPWFVRRYSTVRTKNALAVWDATGDIELPMLSGCCFLVERSFVDRIQLGPFQLFDESFPLYYEDTDLSVRVIKAGRKVVQVHGAKLVHLYNRSGQTAQDEAMSRYWISRRHYYRKWYGRLGLKCYDLSRWFLGTRYAKRRAALPPHPVIHDAGTSSGKPVLHLPRKTKRFLVEIALDPHFYLAAGTFGAGDSWTPSDSLFAGFGPTTFYFRVCDLSTSNAEPLCVWRYTRKHAHTPAPEVAGEGVRHVR